MKLNCTKATKSLAKYLFGLLFVLVGLSLIQSTQAGLDERSEVLSEALTDVKIEQQVDLTTASQRTTMTVNNDAKAIAPADTKDWTPIADPVPGFLITGSLNDDRQARFLFRLPMAWNGKLVVGGPLGTRSEFNGDLVISDYVLQKGYAYASQNKGTLNAEPANENHSNACPLKPIDENTVPGSDANPLYYFHLFGPWKLVSGVGQAVQSSCSARQGAHRRALRS